MEIKIFSAMSEKTVESQVNEFLRAPNIQVQNIQLVGSIFYVAAMVTFERLP